MVKRGRGRPRNLDRPKVNWGYIDSVLVCGEIAPTEDGKATRHGFPTQASIAERAGLSRPAVSAWAIKHDVKKRRAAVRGATSEQDLYASALEEGRIQPPPGAPDPVKADAPLAAAPFKPVDTTGAITKTTRQKVETVLVHGVVRSIGEDLQLVVDYPTVPEIAGVYGLTAAQVKQIAREGRTTARRKAAVDAARDDTDAAVLANRSALVADMHNRLIAITNLYLRKYQQALTESTSWGVSVADLDKLIRLVRLVEGEPDSHTQVDAVFNLAALQDRYSAAQKRVTVAEDIEDAVYEDIGD